MVEGGGRWGVMTQSDPNDPQIRLSDPSDLPKRCPGENNRTEIVNVRHKRPPFIPCQLNRWLSAVAV